MRATEICGEVFCEIWAVFQTVRHLFCKIYKGYESATAALFFVVAVVRYIIIGINGICVLCISIVLQLFKCRKTKKTSMEILFLKQKSPKNEQKHA